MESINCRHGARGLAVRAIATVLLVLSILAPVALAETTSSSFLATLTQAERDWLTQNPRIRLGVDPSWEPFEFIDENGSYRGMASEYIALLNGMLGTAMTPEPGLAWSEVIERSKAGTIDVLPCVVRTPQREEYLNFTRSYLDFPMVVMTRDDATFISGPGDLRDQAIGVVKGYATVDLLEDRFPDIRRVEFDTLEQGLEALSLGRVPAFVDNLASIASVIKTHGFTNLKVAAQTPFSFKLAIAVRKDWPELASILDKALATISDSEADEIQRNWISIKFDYGVDLPYIIRTAMAVGAVVLAILGLVFYWNRRLLVEVRQRKRVEALLAQRNRIHESIAAGVDLDRILVTLADSLEHQLGDALCAVVLLNPDTDIVASVVAPNLPVDFRRKVERHPLKDCLSACTELVERGQRVVLTDIAQDSNWSRVRSNLEPIGIESSWLEPVRNTDGSVLGVLMILKRSRAVPDSEASDLVSETAHLCALAVEQHHGLETQRKLSLAVEHSPNAVMITDVHGVIEYVNPRFHDITGYALEEVVGQTPRILNSGDTDESLYADLWKTILAGDEWWGEIRNVRRDGEHYWSREHVAPIKNARGEVSHFVAIIEDVTEARRISEKVSYQATHDALTDLINRQEFERVLAAAVQSHAGNEDASALCFLDLDQFKVVNDTAGHAAGDELLRQLGRMLQTKLRKGDVLARLGGDEFAVLMHHCISEQAARKADEMRAMIEEFRFAWEDNIFAVGVSIGITEINGGTFSSIQALKEADIACYAAKDAGRNCIHTFRPNDRALLERSGEMHAVNRIKSALEHDRFVLFAQPIVSIAKGEGIAYEVLVRMIDDDGELLLPGAFLPAAERYNLVSRIDHWVVEKTFDWMYRHPEFVETSSGLAINLSGQSLGDDSLLGNVIRHLKFDRLPANKVKFEITETAAIANLTNARSFIAALKEFGVQFALDDFGSGLSSFGYLKNLQVDYLKIDGIFVKDMLVDPIDLAMVKSINDIGHVMGMRTIAEFVEDKQVIDALGRLGIDFAQGYGVGRPVPIDDLLRRSQAAVASLG